MLPRVLAFLITMVMLSSGVAVTEQRFVEALELSASVVNVSGNTKRSDVQGSMDDHWVDDQPFQLLAEPAQDVALLMDMSCTVPRCAIPLPRPVLASESLQAPPLLEGLRRPPRSA